MNITNASNLTIEQNLSIMLNLTDIIPEIKPVLDQIQALDNLLNGFITNSWLVGFCRLLNRAIYSCLCVLQRILSSLLSRRPSPSLPTSVQIPNTTINDTVINNTVITQNVEAVNQTLIEAQRYMNSMMT
jgi:hypothetical protein